jgi:phosphatidylserine synthase
MGGKFSVTPFGRLLFARSLPGLAGIGFALSGEIVLAGLCLVGASVGDLLVDSWASRRGWRRTESDVQVEGFVDFTCFIWAPVQFGVGLADIRISLWIASGAFVVAGAFRLARFNVEGISRGRYQGLPVTYAGIVVPLVALAAIWTEAFSVTDGVSAALAGMAVLMASGRFTVPRISI